MGKVCILAKPEAAAACRRVGNKWEVVPLMAKIPEMRFDGLVWAGCTIRSISGPELLWFSLKLGLRIIGTAHEVDSINDAIELILALPPDASERITELEAERDVALRAYRLLRDRDGYNPMEVWEIKAAADRMVEHYAKRMEKP